MGRRMLFIVPMVTTTRTANYHSGIATGSPTTNIRRALTDQVLGRIKLRAHRLVFHAIVQTPAPYWLQHICCTAASEKLAGWRIVAPDERSPAAGIISGKFRRLSSCFMNADAASLDALPCHETVRAAQPGVPLQVKGNAALCVGRVWTCLTSSCVCQ